MEERQKHFERPTTERPQSLLNLTLLAALFGLLSGFIGYVIAHKANVVGIDSPDNRGGLNINIEQPIVNIARKYQQSIAGVYAHKAAGSANIPVLYDQDDYLGSAVAVTSDGWMMSTDQVIKDNKADIVFGGKVYAIQEIKQDAFTGLVFFKIEANNIQPVDFQLTDDLSVGERLFANLDFANSLDHLYQSVYMAHDHYVVNKFLSSDQADYFIKVSSPVGEVNFLGSAFFNTNGDVIGVYYRLNDEQTLVPAEYIRQAVKHLLDGTERVLLGVHYIDAENNPELGLRGNQLYNPTVRAVDQNSIAAKAGLLVNDQIIAVNNDRVSAKRTLTSLLQDYRVGDKVIFKVIRGGSELDIEVQL